MMNMKINITLRNAAFVFMIGNLLYFMFPFPPIVWRLLSVIVSVYIAYRFITREKMRTFEKLCYAFVAMNLVYYFTSFLWMSPSMTQIGNIMCAMLTFPAFIYLGKKGVLTDRFMIVAMLVLTACSIPAYYHTEQEALKNMLFKEGQTTVNASTYFLMILPLCIINYKKIVSFAVFTICVSFIFMSAKRGNILCAVVPTVMYLYLQSKEAKKSLFLPFVYAIVFAGIGYYLYESVMENEYLLSRFEDTLDGNSSGRDVIYANIWNTWYNSNNICNLLFGYGWDGSINNGGMRAHNDWLELLIDHGLFGTGLYLSMFLSLFSLFLKRKNFYLQAIIIATCSIWFLKTVFSMGYTDGTLSFLALSLAYVYTKYYYSNNLTENK